MLVRSCMPRVHVLYSFFFGSRTEYVSLGIRLVFIHLCCDMVVGPLVMQW